MFKIICLSPAGRRRTYHMIRTDCIRRVYEMALHDGYIPIATILDL